MDGWLCVGQAVQRLDWWMEEWIDVWLCVGQVVQRMDGCMAVCNISSTMDGCVVMCRIKQYDGWIDDCWLLLLYKQNKIWDLWKIIWITFESQSHPTTSLSIIFGVFF